MGSLTELSALSECHYFFITRYSTKQGNVLQTAGCTQWGSTFICKQHGGEGAAIHRRSLIFYSYIDPRQTPLDNIILTHTAQLRKMLSVQSNTTYVVVIQRYRIHNGTEIHSNSMKHSPS
jgi:hypothetical protein